LTKSDVESAKEKTQSMDERTSMRAILEALSEEEIKKVYDSCALVTTGDWDGLALGHPPDLLNGFSKDKMRVYNTFAKGELGVIEQSELVDAACEYFFYLQNQEGLKETPMGPLLASITDPTVLFSEFAIARAGCITPHEFLYEQLINYTYRNEVSVFYGDLFGTAEMQAGVDAALALNVSEEDSNDSVKEMRILEAIQVYNGLQGRILNTPTKDRYIEHMTKHLSLAIDLGMTTYTVPNLSYDHNVHELFQHGFDMRNPFGSNLEGAWLMITNEGSIIYGQTQEQLIEALLIDDFLEKNMMVVSHGADMSKGWDQVISKQLELEDRGIKQEIPEKTRTAFNIFNQNKLKAQLGESSSMAVQDIQQETTHEPSKPH
jgi:hypothetical protein